MKRPTHFLQLSDHDAPFVQRVLDVGDMLRTELRREHRNDARLARMTLAMIFEKPSLRTRVSFETAMTQLGGHAISLQPAEIGLNERERAGDVARVLGGMVDAIVARTFLHQTVEELAASSSVPVINGLSDLAHPVQALADLMTIRDVFGRFEGLKVAYIGDANNVLRSLAIACGLFGMELAVASPAGYGLTEDDRRRLLEQVPGLRLSETTDPIEAVNGADVLYTDTWVSMGQEAEKAERIRVFTGYTVDQRLLDATGRPSEAIVLHCLPAYRGLEISADMVDGPRSRVFEQAHNRLHAQKGLLAVVLGVA